MMRLFKKSCMLFALLFLIATQSYSAENITQVAQVPAFLPNKSDVAKTKPMPIDGVWLVSPLGKKIRVEEGRAYALEPWVHMFVLEIKPDMVTTKDLKPVAPSKYEAYDLPVNGPSKWEVVEGGDIQATVKGPLGPANFKLIPIALDNKDWYISEMKKAVLDPPSDYYDTSPPGYDPTPPGYEPTPPGYDPGPPGDDPIDDPVLPGPPGEEPGIQPIPKPKPLPKPRPIVIPGDVTPDCGGDGQIICTTKPAYRAGKAAKLGCPGKNLHFSPRNGGECWSCPSGYKRTLNFITSKKACLRKLLKGRIQRQLS